MPTSSSARRSTKASKVLFESRLSLPESIVPERLSVRPPRRKAHSRNSPARCAATAVESPTASSVRRRLRSSQPPTPRSLRRFFRRPSRTYQFGPPRPNPPPSTHPPPPPPPPHPHTPP